MSLAVVLVYRVTHNSTVICRGCADSVLLQEWNHATPLARYGAPCSAGRGVTTTVVLLLVYNLGAEAAEDVRKRKSNRRLWQWHGSGGVAERKNGSFLARVQLKSQHTNVYAFKHVTRKRGAESSASATMT